MTKQSILEIAVLRSEWQQSKLSLGSQRSENRKREASFELIFLASLITAQRDPFGRKLRDGTIKNAISTWHKTDSNV